VRFALLTPLVAAGALFACSTFSSAEEPPQPPPSESDGGSGEAAAMPDTCAPNVFDPNAPSACPGVDLQTDSDNCGACGHRCRTANCVAGICEREELTKAQPILAIDGTKLYVPLGSKILRADLTRTERPLPFETYFDNQTGTVNHLEVHGGELYIGWDNNQTILELNDPPTPRTNDGYLAVKTDVVDGHYFPGATSYYLFRDKTAGWNLARIPAADAVQFEKESSFLPIARSGDAFYWTQRLGTGSTAKIVGPWERADDEALAIVDATIEGFAFGAEGDTAFIASGGFLSRSTRGAKEVKRLAKEEGAGVAFAVEGDQLFYAVRRTIGEQERHRLFRIDKCKGGAPVPLMDINVAILGIYLNEPTHVLVNTTSGLFRMPR
jgi:hypothetical protein